MKNMTTRDGFDHWRYVCATKIYFRRSHAPDRQSIMGDYINEQMLGPHTALYQGKNKVKSKPTKSRPKTYRNVVGWTTCQTSVAVRFAVDGVHEECIRASVVAQMTHGWNRCICDLRSHPCRTPCNSWKTLWPGHPLIANVSRVFMYTPK